MNKIKYFICIIFCFIQVGFPSCRKCKSVWSFAQGMHCGIELRHYDSSGYDWMNSNSIRYNNYKLVLNVNIAIDDYHCRTVLNTFSFFSNPIQACEASGTFLEGIKDSIIGFEIYDKLGFLETDDTLEISNRFEFISFSAYADTFSRPLESLRSKYFKDYVGPHSDTDVLGFNLIPKEKPLESKWHQFEVRLFLSDNKVLEHTTDSIYLY